MEFLKSCKAKSVPSSALSSKLPGGQSSLESLSSDNIGSQSDSAVDVEMEAEKEELSAPPPVTGMISFLFFSASPDIHSFTRQ